MESIQKTNKLKIPKGETKNFLQGNQRYTKNEVNIHISSENNYVEDIDEEGDENMFIQNSEIMNDDDDYDEIEECENDMNFEEMKEAFERNKKIEEKIKEIHSNNININLNNIEQEKMEIKKQ